MNEPILLVLTSCPDEPTAERIATALVEERLAACVNRVGPVDSVFWWQDRVSREREWLLLVKTTAAAYPSVEERIKTMHPYEVAEVIAVPVTRGSAGYLAWLRDNAGAGAGGGR